METNRDHRWVIQRNKLNMQYTERGMKYAKRRKRQTSRSLIDWPFDLMWDFLEKRWRAWKAWRAKEEAEELAKQVEELTGEEAFGGVPQPVAASFPSTSQSDSDILQRYGSVLSADPGGHQITRPLSTLPASPRHIIRAALCEIARTVWYPRGSPSVAALYRRGIIQSLAAIHFFIPDDTLPYGSHGPLDFMTSFMQVTANLEAFAESLRASHTSAFMSHLDKEIERVMGMAPK